MLTVADVANVHDFRGLEADLDKLREASESEKKKIGNGSTFICIDTGDVYIYDRENDEWLLLG